MSDPGAAERLVAVSAHCDFPSEVLQLRRWVVVESNFRFLCSIYFYSMLI